MKLEDASKAYKEFKQKRTELFSQIKDAVDFTGGSAKLVDDDSALEFTFLDHKFKLVGLCKNNYKIIDFVLSDIVYSTDNYPFERMEENKEVKAVINGATAHVNGHPGDIKIFGAAFIEELFEYVKVKNPSNFI